MTTNATQYATHPNGCTECGAFRPDGQHPTVHRHKCSAGPDGSTLNALYTLPADRQTVPAHPRKPHHSR